jgi:hypothetical protein
MIKLRENIIFKKPAERIREYCEIEKYRDYDGEQNINNFISEEDIQAAIALYTTSSSYDKTQTAKLLEKSKQISKFLDRIPNTPLHKIPIKDWEEQKQNIQRVLDLVMDVEGFGLDIATMILHLKRPEIFPILDNYVVHFLLEDTQYIAEMNLDQGMKCIELARTIIRDSQDGFVDAQRKLKDLPIRLSIIRIFDILCWTTAKWDLEGDTSATYGTASKTLLER